MMEPTSSPYLVPFDDSFRVADSPTTPPSAGGATKGLKKRLRELTAELDDLQRVLYARDRCAVLLIFQAMDAAGKDSTIRAVMSGINPAGCQVYSFKQPSSLELDHDFLWRTTVRLPERGRIGVFNRSYYEEVLVVRVHPEILDAQRLPELDSDHVWEQRFDSIRDQERHLARNGTTILKFWLNVSREEQRLRFLSRLDEPHKQWKFSRRDIEERGHWDDYMKAYQAALAATSRPWAPWYAIPADDKPYTRVCVADILVRTLRSFGMAYPNVTDEARQEFDAMRALLDNEDAG